jgi:sec-independent protein translocase protein TatB
METSWSELMIIGIVALIVIGPKDLPGMFRELGRFSAKIRAMGREFTRAMEAAAKESGVKDVASDLRAVTSPKAMGLDAVRSAADKFEKWDPLKPSPTAAKPVTPPPMPPTTIAPALTPVTPAVAPVGPATAALADKVAAKKAAATEKVAAMKAAKAASVAPVAAAEVVDKPKAVQRGRVRKKAAPEKGDEA